MNSTARHLFTGALIAVCTSLPLAAAAQEARTAKPVNLRAGPARDYPLVASYGPGAPISVQGCTAGYGWCDVIGPDGARGWIFAANIVYPYQNRQVPVLTYGATLGLPIITFAIGSYWGSYYRNRPWYGNRGHWAQRPPPVYRPGPPAFRPPAYRPPAAHFTPPPRQESRPPMGGGGRPPGFRPPDAGRPPMGDRSPGGPSHMGSRPSGPPAGGDHGGGRGGGERGGGGGGGGERGGGGGDHGGGRGGGGGGPGHPR